MFTRAQAAEAEEQFPLLDDQGRVLRPGRTKRLGRAFGKGDPSSYVSKDTYAAYRQALEAKVRVEGRNPYTYRDEPGRFVRPMVIAKKEDIHRTGSCITPMDAFRHADTFRHMFEEVLGLARFALRVRLTYSLYHTGRLVFDYHKSVARKYIPDPVYGRYCTIDGQWVHTLTKRIRERSQTGSMSPSLMSPSEYLDVQWVYNRPEYLQSMIYTTGFATRGTIKLYFKPGDILVLKRPCMETLPPSTTILNGMTVPNPDRLVVRIDEVIPELEDPNFGVISVTIVEELPRGTLIRDILAEASDYSTKGQRISALPPL